ncbi:protein FAM177B-like [Bufo gargarizans]|uniref:protein FAM177B-like n=1 Tax=Bufo gargarizans TaxID=30331 RepID=UPI001CF1C7DB|nr:protein FAM177B-like [Bufo gargarizans]
MTDGDMALKEVELGDEEKKRVPRKIIHFASGETMEEYSTEEEDEEEDDQRVDFQNVDMKQMSWRTYVQFWILRIATTAFFTCDYLGGQLANLFGLNASKYQYAIDEYHRAQEEDSDDDEDDESVKETGDKNSENESHYLQMQSMEYGTINVIDNTSESEDKYQMDSEILQSNN